WSERLADYKALQAELEAQAFLDAAEADEDSEDDEDLDDEVDGEETAEDSEEQIEEVLFDIALEDSNEIESVEELSDSGEELAATNLDESEPAEGDAETTGRKPPRFFGRRKRGKDFSAAASGA
ncbi:MAG: hypothetical protein RLZZ90_709, partial [Actinomycetota bacterium]